MLRLVEHEFDALFVGSMARGGRSVRSQFVADAPNQKWVAGFTYIWTAQGWLYVAAVIDLFSHRVVGWSMSATMTAQLVADAMMMAIWRRGKPDALLHHSDQGSQGGFNRWSQHPRYEPSQASGRELRREFSNPGFYEASC
ncbi:hypothetical protein NRB_12040 [Novosphingobium sp. 11B]